MNRSQSWLILSFCSLLFLKSEPKMSLDLSLILCSVSVWKWAKKRDCGIALWFRYINFHFLVIWDSVISDSVISNSVISNSVISNSYSVISNSYSVISNSYSVLSNSYSVISNSLYQIPLYQIHCGHCEEQARMRRTEKGQSSYPGFSPCEQVPWRELPNKSCTYSGSGLLG